MNLTFYVRGKTVYARINSGKRGLSSRVSTGIKATGNFDESRQRFIDRSEQSIRNNERLRVIEKRFDTLAAQGLTYDSIADCLVEKVPVVNQDDEKLMLLSYMEERVESIEKGERSKSKRPYSYDTVTAFRSSLRNYLRFVEDTGCDINLYDVDLYSKKSREDREAAASAVHGVMYSYLDWMIEQGYKPNTQKHYLNMVNRFIAMAEKQKLISVPKETLPPGEEFPIVTLPESFVANFVADTYGMYDKLPDRLKWVYEVSVVILLTTFRIKDAINLKRSDLFLRGNSASIRIISSKRKKQVFVPIPVSFYNLLVSNHEKYGSVYTKCDIPVEKYTYQIHSKELFSLYDELSAPHSIERMLPDNTGTHTITKPFKDFITAHALRRTAITLMLINGVPEIQVKWASGHSYDSKSFKKYVDYVDSIMNSGISAYQERLLSKALYVPQEMSSS